MNLVRWDPFREMDSLFERALPRTLAGWPRMGFENGGKYDWSPSTDVSETEKEYLIRAEVPSVKKEDVKVTVEDGVITIQGERRQQEDQNEKFHRVESFYGSFARTFTLPKGIKVEDIRCENKDGVLTVHIPKEEKAKARPKQIRVE